MHRRAWARRGLAAALLAAGGAAAEPVSALHWSASAGAMHRRLTERSADGARLVAESGPLLQLQMAAELQLPRGGALRGVAELAAGKLDYAGQAQSGAAVASDTRHGDASLTLAWRPHAPHPTGSAWLSLRALQQRRAIASAGTVQGLDESSRLWLAGLRLERSFQAAGWQWQPWLAARISLDHQLRVDYGGAFDSSHLHGGRRRELELGLGAGPSASAWRFELTWTGARQSASESGALYRGGSAIGTVRQPRIAIDDVALRGRLAF